MPLITTLNRLFVLAACVEVVSAWAVFPEKIEPAPQPLTVKIEVDERSMIIVPVSLNGSRPYNFVLDTGCSKSIVDRKLAGELGLPPAGEKSVTGVLASAKLSVVHVKSLSVAGATVEDGEVFSVEHSGNVTGNVRGVLGEDFLRNFDLLIDYRRRMLRLESAAGAMARSAVGEHLPLQTTTTYHAKLTPNRLLIAARIPELSDSSMSLLLDSGTNQLTLFREGLGPGGNQTEPILTANFSRWIASEATARRIHSLNLGHTSISNLIVVALSRGSQPNADGLLPISLFHSVLISHFGRFVILNPSFRKSRGDALAATALAVADD